MVRRRMPDASEPGAGLVEQQAVLRPDGQRQLVADLQARHAADLGGQRAVAAGIGIGIGDAAEMFDDVLGMIEDATISLFRQLEPALRPGSRAAAFPFGATP